MTTEMPKKHFLFLQGPHGPFFAALGKHIELAGADVSRIGFNSGDERFWNRSGYIAFNEPTEEWPQYLSDIIEKRGITDLVFYGSSRPIHIEAQKVARNAQLRIHCFEEGYLRPYWVTYERSGANASSEAMSISLDQMENALDGRQTGLTEVPDHWGDMREHMFWGAVYHASLVRGAKRYQYFQPHRTPDVRGEFWLYLKRLIQTPRRAIVRRLATSKVRHGGFPYHLVLLQLAHDANFRDHGPFPNQAAFLETVFKGFSEGAPRHHHLVLKAHPLEDGREPLRPLIDRLTKTFDLEGRIHFLSGGKLAPLLNTAKSAVTVNSTAAEQVLWRGLPLKVFGAAIYHRDEFCSSQSAAGFFRDPELPNKDAYLQYRSFLLSTSQIAGGFYALRNRRKLLRQLPDIMLNEHSPYEQLLAPKAQNAASRQHLTQV